jgi:hypothetical protein
MLLIRKDLLDALHEYAQQFYQGEMALKCDSSSLLALGVFVQEFIRHLHSPEQLPPVLNGQSIDLIKVEEDIPVTVYEREESTQKRRYMDRNAPFDLWGEDARYQEEREGVKFSEKMDVAGCSRCGNPESILKRRGIKGSYEWLCSNCDDES